MSNSSIKQVRELVHEDFEAVNQIIVSQLRSNVELVENIGEYIVAAGGKRLRPLLTLLAAKALDYQGDKHRELATVIEFLHTATLLHDDVVDVSALRRGRATANAKWGNAPSVLVGDFIYSRAFQMLVAMDNWEIMQLLSDTTNCIAEGEVLQLTKAGDPNTDEAAYLEVIRCKTAVLFAAATKGAALLANADKTTAETLYHYGLDLGIAFQLTDDVLDYEGDPAEMGKNVGDDLAEGKPTLPLIYAMKHGTDTQARLINDAILNKDVSKLTDVISTVSSTGALEHTKKRAQAYANSAKNAIEQLPESAYRQSLVTLADIAADRSA